MNTSLLPFPRRRAFTLIELLVVIAIIAILAAILFPVFAQAKAAAKKTACLSNVKQMSVGSMLYMGDFDDTVVPLTQSPQGKTVYWWGTVETGKAPDLTASPLQPYMKSVALQDCPTAAGLPTDPFTANGAQIPVAYGLSGQLAGKSASIVDLAAETAVFGDSAGIGYAPPAYQPAVYRKVDLNAFYTIGRHSGFACIGWFDGHAKAMKTHPYDFRNPLEKANNIGPVLKGPPQFTGYGDPDFVRKSNCDSYYYLAQKPTDCGF